MQRQRCLSLHKEGNMYMYMYMQIHVLTCTCVLANDNPRVFQKWGTASTQPNPHQELKKKQWQTDYFTSIFSPTLPYHLLLVTKCVHVHVVYSVQVLYMNHTDMNMNKCRCTYMYMYMYMMRKLRNIFREPWKTGCHPGLNQEPLT